MVLFICVIGVFFRFYQLDATSSADLYAPALGVLTILGLYLFVSEIFDWHIAGITSFLLAISHWHVTISRTELQATLLPLLLVFTFYFLWRGLRRSELKDFFCAGVLSGLAFYIPIPYHLSFLVAILLFINYWFFLKKDYSGTEYIHARNRLLAGCALFGLVTFFVAVPALIQFIQNPQSLLSAGNYTIPNIPMFGWPIALFCVIGFFKEFGHWISRKHGHFSPVHTLLFSWFFIMLAPQFFKFQAPSALQTFAVLPVIIIFAGRGIWWIFNVLEEWEMIAQPWKNRGHKQFIAPVMALFILLGALGIYEYNRTFNIWHTEQTLQLQGAPVIR